MRCSPPAAIAESLRASGAWLGASWLVRLRDEGFVLALKPRPHATEISAIGGKVESGESFLAAALREYEEETGCDPPRVVALPAPELFGVEAVPVPGVDGACALVRKRVRVPRGDEGVLWIAVFLGITARDPRPVEKIPAFLVVPPERFGALASGGVRCGRVIGDLPDAAARGEVIVRDTPAALATRPETIGLLWTETSRWVSTIPEERA